MFTRYDTDLGAEVDITEVYRYDTDLNAEVGAEAVYKYDTDLNAEVEVWSSQGKFVELERSTDYGYVVASGENAFSFSIKDFHYTNDYFTCYVEGDFVNPTLEFDYVGGTAYIANSSGYYTYKNDKIYLQVYTRTVDGTENYTLVTTDSNSTIGTATNFESGSVALDLEGEFDRIGFKIILDAVYASTSSYTMDVQTLTLSDIIIDGKMYAIDESCIY